jgi:hypothetical protein
LPCWDSMDWMSLLLELERELGERPSESIEEWSAQTAFSVRELVLAVHKNRSRRDAQSTTVDQKRYSDRSRFVTIRF